jgi:hypothetical protein
MKIQSRLWLTGIALVLTIPAVALTPSETAPLKTSQQTISIHKVNLSRWVPPGHNIPIRHKK